LTTITTAYGVKTIIKEYPDGRVTKTTETPGEEHEIYSQHGGDPSSSSYGQKSSKPLNFTKNFHLEKDEDEDGVKVNTIVDNGIKTVIRTYDDGTVDKSSAPISEEEVQQLQKEAKDYQQDPTPQTQSYKQKAAKLMALLQSGGLSENQLNKMLRAATSN